MEFTETYEKDKGPIVRWIATKLLNALQRLEEPLYDYALMYEVTFNDEDDDPINDDQLVIF